MQEQITQELINEIKDGIVNRLKKRQLGYLKMKLYLVELILADVPYILPVRIIEEDISLAKSVVSKAIAELKSEGWLSEHMSDNATHKYYMISLDKNLARVYKKVWMHICLRSKKSEVMRKRINMIMPDMIKWKEKKWPKSKVG